MVNEYGVTIKNGDGQYWLRHSAALRSADDDVTVKVPSNKLVSIRLRRDVRRQKFWRMFRWRCRSQQVTLVIDHVFS